MVDDELQRGRARSVPAILTESLPEADVVVYPDRVHITVALAGRIEQRLDVAVEGHQLRLVGSGPSEKANFVVPLPVAVAESGMEVADRNGVVDITLHRAPQQCRIVAAD